MTCFGFRPPDTEGGYPRAMNVPRSSLKAGTAIAFIDWQPSVSAQRREGESDADYLARRGFEPRGHYAFRILTDDTEPPIVGTAPDLVVLMEQTWGEIRWSVELRRAVELLSVPPPGASMKETQMHAILTSAS
jgi:hypothetical protein